MSGRVNFVLLVAAVLSVAGCRDVKRRSEPPASATDAAHAAIVVDRAGGKPGTGDQPWAGDKPWIGKIQSTGPWIKQGDDCRVGHIVVRVTSASVRHPDFRGGRDGEGDVYGGKLDKEYLVVRLEVRNTSDTLKTTYTTWGNKRFTRPMSLTDGLGNSYVWLHGIIRIPEGRFGDMFVDWIRLLDGPSNSSASRTPSDGAILYPGQSTTDLFAFERPVDAAMKLHLELPGENCGLDRPFRLEIDLGPPPPPPEPTAAQLAKARERAETDEPAVVAGSDRPAEVRKAAETLTRLRRARAVLERFPQSVAARAERDASVETWARAAVKLDQAKAAALEAALADAKAKADREHPVLKTGPAQDQIKSRTANDKAVKELTEAARAKVEANYDLPTRKGESPK